MSRYVEIARVLEAEIGHLPANSSLPTEEEYSSRFRVSRGTIRRTLRMLELAGLISRRRGRGTIVSPPKVMRRLMPGLPFEEDMRAQGISFTTRLLEHARNTVPAAEVSRALRLSPAAAVDFLSAVRLVDGRVVCHDRRYIPTSILEGADLTQLGQVSLQQILGQHLQMPVALSHWVTEIIPATDDIAQALGVTAGVLVLSNDSTHHLVDGTPVQCVRTYYRVDCVKFHFSAPYAVLDNGPWGNSVGPGVAKDSRSLTVTD